MKRLTHTDDQGRARMVDVTRKDVTERMARARGFIRMRPETLQTIREGTTAKGDVVAVARVAGIMAAKKTAELVPLCHPLPLTDVDLTIDFDEALPGMRVMSTARTAARTGVEMEALVAVSVTLITIFDMVKGLDRDLIIGDVCITEKRGGKSGDWSRP